MVVLELAQLCMVFNTEGQFFAYLAGLTSTIIKLVVFSYLPENERILQNLSLQKFGEIIRKRLSEEHTEIKDDLVNLSAGVIHKFQTVVNDVSV